MYLVTAAEMRELDRLTIEEYGTPGHLLMDSALPLEVAIRLYKYGMLPPEAMS